MSSKFSTPFMAKSPCKQTTKKVWEKPLPKQMKDYKKIKVLRKV